LLINKLIQKDFEKEKEDSVTSMDSFLEGDDEKRKINFIEFETEGVNLNPAISDSFKVEFDKISEMLNKDKLEE